MKLGEVIAELEKHDPAKVVAHGFGDPDSYRGWYERVAFEPVGPTTVGEMLTHARSAVGATFEGWKGGRYTMDVDTVVHIAERGETDGHGDGEGLTPVQLAAMLNSGPTDNRRPTHGIEKMTHADATAYFASEVRRWQAQVRALPLPERLRVAADLLEDQRADMSDAARAVVRHVLDELDRGEG